jgi:hypothetical protein
MIFQSGLRNYLGETACEIVRQIEADEDDYPYRGQSIRQFLDWSFRRQASRLPQRESDLSHRMKDEELALNYLCLCDEYGTGRLLIDRDIEG